MVRNKVDLCFICDCAPCECNKQAPKQTRSPSTPKPVAVEAEPPVKAVATKRSFLDAMKAKASDDVPRYVPPQRPALTPGSTMYPSLSDEELVFHAAIRALVPILAPEEIIKYRDIIVTKRISDWRKRFKEETQRV